MVKRICDDKHISDVTFFMRLICRCRRIEGFWQERSDEPLRFWYPFGMRIYDTLLSRVLTEISQWTSQATLVGVCAHGGEENVLDTLHRALKEACTHNDWKRTLPELRTLYVTTTLNKLNAVPSQEALDAWENVRPFDMELNVVSSSAYFAALVGHETPGFEGLWDMEDVTKVTLRIDFTDIRSVEAKKKAARTLSSAVSGVPMGCKTITVSCAVSLRYMRYVHGALKRAMNRLRGFFRPVNVTKSTKYRYGYSDVEMKYEIHLNGIWVPSSDMESVQSGISDSE